MSKTVNNHTDNQLVGRCPICPDPSADTTANDAYVASTINDSDKDKYLVWSIYYELFVCQLCKKDGEDLSVDVVRDEYEKDQDKSRQKMGFRNTYVTNPSIN